ncbi:MAG: hypothetical protein ACTHMZ_12215 [Actinomycetes bacterium]
MYAIAGAFLAATVLTGCGGDAQDAAVGGSPSAPSSSTSASPLTSGLPLTSPATSPEATTSEPSASEPRAAGPMSAEATSSGPTRSTRATQPETASTSSRPPSTSPVVIAYAGGESPGVEVHQPSDVSKLDGAPESFKKFVAGIVRKLTSTTAPTCDAAAVGVIVEAVRADGYATGGVNDCGGYHALWATVGGQWKEIAGTQDIWECPMLQRYDVPSDIAGDKCYDPEAKEVRDYRQS